MPLPAPRKNESMDDFMERCMGNPTMNKDFPETDQRAAVCHSQWEKKEKGELTLEERASDLLGNRETQDEYLGNSWRTK